MLTPFRPALLVCLAVSPLVPAGEKPASAPSLLDRALAGPLAGGRGIVVCNVPPFGDAAGYTAGKETQRGLLNTSIANWVAANPGVAVLADFDTTLKDGGDPTKINPAYLDHDQWINDAGQTALVGLVGPLLP